MKSLSEMAMDGFLWSISYIGAVDGCRVVLARCNECETPFEEELEAAKAKSVEGFPSLCISCDGSSFMSSGVSVVASRARGGMVPVDITRIRPLSGGDKSGLSSGDVVSLVESASYIREADCERVVLIGCCRCCRPFESKVEIAVFGFCSGAGVLCGYCSPESEA